MFKKMFAICLAVMTIQSNFVLANGLNSEDIDMTRTDICKKNYRILFNGEALTPTGDDPEMMAILQKYIFGEIFTVGELDIKTREMLTVTSLAVQQTLPQLKAHINGALNAGATPVELREAIYQLAPFIGFPKTLNALSVLNEVFKERGIDTPLKSTATVKEEERYEKGLEIQNPLYGDEIKVAMEGLPADMGADVSRFLTVTLLTKSSSSPRIKAYFAVLEAFSNCLTNFLFAKSISQEIPDFLIVSASFSASAGILEIINAVVFLSSLFPIKLANLSIPIANPIAGISSPPKFLTRLSYLPPPQTAF